MHDYEYNKAIRLGEMNSLNHVLGDYMDTIDKDRVNDYMSKWNFYEGYHWEEIPMTDKPQITKNYCRSFVNKFVAFEFGKGFTIRVPFEDDDNDETPTPILDYLNSVWDDMNSRLEVCNELGQTKGVTGEGWLQVKYEKVGDFIDPFDEYPNGRIRILSMSPMTIFPEWNDHDKNKLEKLTIMYPVDTEAKTIISRKTVFKKKAYRVVWTNTEFAEYLDNEEISRESNPYGFIPFVHFINFPLANKTVGAGDLDDLIPLNVELNLKNSDISEIIDYHSSPVTVVYGADIDSLERGANKMWGGLPIDAKIENLEMQSDMSASISFIEGLKKGMHEVCNLPENALGDIASISNTSGVALQIMNMPLLERTMVKRTFSESSLKQVNKMLIFMGVMHNIITKPTDRENKELYKTEIVWKDPLPKDGLIELQQLQTEMQMGLESRAGAFNRLGKDGKKIQSNLEKDIDKYPEWYGIQKEDPMAQLNSGMTNGSTPQEMKRKAMTGQNKRLPNEPKK